MRTKAATLLAVSLLSFPGGAQQKTAPHPPTSAHSLPQNPIAQLAWLVGGL